MRSLVKLSPGKVIYISCNPNTLARDLHYLSHNGYRIKKDPAGRYVPTHEPCGVRDNDDEEQINKQDGIVNKTFVEMLDKLGNDIQITYMKKETN